GHQLLVPQANVVLQIEVEAHGVTHFKDRWGREHHDLSVLDLAEARLDTLGEAEYVLAGVAAQGPVLQLHEGRARVLTTPGEVEAVHRLHRGDDSRLVFQQVFADLGQYGLGALGTGVGRHPHLDHQQALVLIRQEGGRDLLEQKASADHDQQEHHQVATTALQHAADAPLET